ADEYFSERSLYKGHISLIAGLPKDVPETLDKTVDWIRKNWHSRKNSTSMFALQIKSDFFAGHDTHSELDRKASEFGYREMTPEEYDAIIPSDHQRIEGNMYWMNDADNTNWWQMHLYSNNYTNTTFHEQGFPVWSIPYWKMIHTDEEIDEMQGKPWAHFLPPDFVDELVSEYISQKL
ncbi:MAG: hypothetical protein EBY48_07510, partial [Opitutae bacterium]|nr:hypothetical protein [Opitutae bacterium]